MSNTDVAHYAHIMMMLLLKICIHYHVALRGLHYRTRTISSLNSNFQDVISFEISTMNPDELYFRNNDLRVDDVNNLMSADDVLCRSLRLLTSFKWRQDDKPWLALSILLQYLLIIPSIRQSVSESIDQSLNLNR